MRDDVQVEKDSSFTPFLLLITLITPNFFIFILSQQLEGREAQCRTLRAVGW